MLKEAGLEVNAEKTVCFMFRHQSTGQNRYTRIANKSFQNVANFKSFRKNVTNKNCVHKEIMSRLNSGNACYEAV
jgi:hypothetical protein